MAEEKLDIVVIGGGPAGYISAIRAAQAGAKTALVERSSLGGTCLNVGCIPTKVLTKTAELYTYALHLDEFGINTGQVSLDFQAVQKRKRQVVEMLKGGVGRLLRANGVAHIAGEALLKSPKLVEVKLGHEKTQLLKLSKLILANGSYPIPLPGLPFDGEQVLSSSDALELQQVPASLLVVGGGVVGVEFASIFAQLGAKVHLVEMLPAILPFLDHEIAEALKAQLLAKGVTLHLATKVGAVQKTAGGLSAVLANREGETKIEAEKMLVAAGRAPNAGGEDLKAIGVALVQGAIKVDAAMETSVSGVYAAGDVCGGFQLAHAAFHEAEVAAANCTGGNKTANLRVVPQCIFTNPEVAGVGLTEQEAKKKYGELIVARYPFSANGKALASGVQSGMVKVIADRKYREILGCFIIGPSATEMIHQVSLAMSMEGVLDDLANTIYAHPTLSETIGEVALLGLNRPLHLA